jgi:aryl-alcohol dehydrogenase-like predicted oxidoreductase
MLAGLRQHSLPCFKDVILWAGFHPLGVDSKDQSNLMLCGPTRGACRHINVKIMSLDSPFVPRRPLGVCGFHATAFGIGDLADRNIAIEDCVSTVRRAMDAGLNVIDTAPLYEDGYSEEIVGRALNGTRDRMFLIDKIDALEQSVGPQVDDSLMRLKLEYTDAFVFHNLSSMEKFESLRQPGGGFDQLADCVRAGKTRFRGISSHHPDVLKAAISAGVCDLVMFPLGPFVDARYVDEILPLAKARNVGTVCFKTFGAGKLVGDTEGYNQPLKTRPRGKVSSGGSDNSEAMLPRLSVAECLHYTLTLDPDVALLGLSFPNEQDQAFAAAREFLPLSMEEMKNIRNRAAEARRGKGPCWWNPNPEA